ncbi:MAG: deoxyribodipyrimidine photo-lyase [Spirochaetales bacterium]|nr:deoxyribodipyrimidine photo-lyase [Spirochaetales bacterium]
MQKRYRRALFLFRRDLRLEDNVALREAGQNAAAVLACFILDPRQKNHPYFSVPGSVFMRQSLAILNESLRERGGELLLLEGHPAEKLGQVFAAESIEAIYFNKDYTPFARKRDEEIEKLCRRSGVACQSFHDALLMPPGSILKENKEPYTVFTPYYKKTLLRRADRPQNLECSFFRARIHSTTLEMAKAGSLAVTGGRREGLHLLHQTASQPQNERDNLDLPTSRLSAHLKFGTLSVREVFHALKGQETLQRALIWRDFFTTIAWYFPFVFETAFQEKRRHIHWQTNAEAFQRWCEGTTGFPLVDAGMRELRSTGFMHNRLRMVTASFLIKDLHQNWQTGEAFFARNLADYDPAVNNGNWQWVAGTGCDHAPYFRIFNPWTQQKRFDPEARYIKRWLPELQGLPPRQIHRLDRERITGYPPPMIDHAREARICLDLYRI